MKKWYKKQNNVIAVGAVMILLIAIGYTYFSTPKEELQTGMIIKVNYKDGSSQIFDSNTLTPGAIVGIDRPGFSSITTIVNIKPIVEASDGSTPRTPIPGKPITVQSGGIRIFPVSLTDTAIGFGIKDWDIPIGTVLTPNVDNKVIDDSSITPTFLDSLSTAYIPAVGGDFKLRLESKTLGISVYMGGTQKIGHLNPVTMRFRKDVGSNPPATTTYTLQSVSVSGSFN